MSKSTSEYVANFTGYSFPFTTCTTYLEQILSNETIRCVFDFPRNCRFKLISIQDILIKTFKRVFFHGWQSRKVALSSLLNVHLNCKNKTPEQLLCCPQNDMCMLDSLPALASKISLTPRQICLQRS